MLTLILLMTARRGVRETRIPNVELVALRLSPQNSSKKRRFCNPCCLTRVFRKFNEKQTTLSQGGIRKVAFTSTSYPIIRKHNPQFVCVSSTNLITPSNEVWGPSTATGLKKMSVLRFFLYQQRTAHISAN